MASAPIALANLSLSWILLDRVVNVSGQRPVTVDQKWLTSDMVVRFGLVLDGSSERRLGGAALQNAKERVGLCRSRSAQILFWRVIILGTVVVFYFLQDRIILRIL
jgi:hypothetical protein